GEGAGRYAFATDVRGRVVFDANVLALPDALWLDIDLFAISTALAHLNRYVIVEDVAIQDASGDWARLGCSGPKAPQVAQALGVSDLMSLAPLAHVPVDSGMRLMRHDFAGMPGFELIVPHDSACATWDRLAAFPGIVCAGRQTLEVLQIE